MGYRSNGNEIETAKAENRKGKMDMPSKPTIDIVPQGELRINGYNAFPAEAYPKIPQAIPRPQLNARIVLPNLRCSSKEAVVFCSVRTIPPSKKTDVSHA